MNINKKTLAVVLIISFLAFSAAFVSVRAGTIWTTSSVGTSQPYTESVSLVLDSSGTPHIAYCDSSNHIEYATWTGSSWNTQLVATDGSYSTTWGSWVSLALDSNGNPYISYYAQPYALKFAYINDGVWTTQVVDSSSAGISNSIAIDSSGNPHIAYYSGATYGVMYASLTGSIGSTWTTAQVDSGDCVGISLAFDNSGNAHISYRDYNYITETSYLKYASLSGSTWTPTSIASISQYDGCITSLAFSPTTHNPSISYYNYGSYDLMFVTYSGSSWGTPQVVDSASGMQIGIYNSLAFDSQGNPAIAYYSVTTSGTDGALKIAYYQNSAWNIQTVDAAMNDGTGNLSPVSLAFNANGTPCIAYATAVSSTNTIKYTSGVGSPFVAPEYAYGALAAIIAAFVAVVTFTVVKKRQQQ
jgi:hypothetical protein